MAIVSPLEIQTAYRYEDEELPFIIDLIMGAEFFLYNAGAYKPENPMTKTVVTLIVGFWLDNRESNYTDYHSSPHYSMQKMKMIHHRLHVQKWDWGIYHEESKG